MDTLKNALERHIKKIILMPLFGTRYEFESVNDVLVELNILDLDHPSGRFERFEVIIDYSNHDEIRATFQNKTLLVDFLRKLES